MKGVETLTKDSTVVNQLSVDSACSHTNWTAVTKDGQKIKMKYGHTFAVSFNCVYINPFSASLYVRI